MTDLGNDLDIPFEENPPGQGLTFGDGLISGGVVVMAIVAPVPGVGPKPGLVFRFTGPDGRFYKPIVLVADEDQIRNATPLVAQAVNAAIRAARKAFEA